LLVKGLKNQIRELENNQKYSIEVDEILIELNKELKNAENNLIRFNK
jgi:hypothetical protein